MRRMQMRSYPTFTSNEATREPPSRYTGVRGAHLLEGTEADQCGKLGTAQGAAAIVDVNSIRGLYRKSHPSRHCSVGFGGIQAAGIA